MAELEIPERAWTAFERDNISTAFQIVVASKLRRIAPMLRCFDDMRRLVAIADELDPPEVSK